MDFSNASGEQWDWHDDDDESCWLHKDSSSLDIPRSLWDEEEEESMHLFDETTTPVENCTDLDYLVSAVGYYGDNTKKGTEDCREHLQLKRRRRMLQFNSLEIDPCEQISSAVGQSKGGEDSLMDEGGDIDISDALHGVIQWGSRFPDRCTSGSEGLYHTSDSWLDNCLNDSEMQFNTDDVYASYELSFSMWHFCCLLIFSGCCFDSRNFYGVTEDQVDISEFCTVPPEMETETLQGSVAQAPLSIFTGSKSLIRTPTKLATPVAYPFALIKPCGVQGDVTLKDINQRILTPPSKAKHTKDDDASSSYPTSALSGKPVVVKTKITTEGGKGSITITRTRG